MKEQLKSWAKECQDDPKSHIDGELLEKYAKGEQIDKKLLGPHVRCMVTKSGFMKENGDLDVETIRSKLSGHIDDAKLEEIIKECAQQKDTPEKTALRWTKCMKDHRGEH